MCFFLVNRQVQEWGCALRGDPTSSQTHRYKHTVPEQNSDRGWYQGPSTEQAMD